MLLQTINMEITRARYKFEFEIWTLVLYYGAKNESYANDHKDLFETFLGYQETENCLSTDSVLIIMLYLIIIFKRKLFSCKMIWY